MSHLQKLNDLSVLSWFLPPLRLPTHPQARARGVCLRHFHISMTQKGTNVVFKDGKAKKSEEEERRGGAGRAGDGEGVRSQEEGLGTSGGSTESGT